jgi:hypothetical protein
MRVSQDGRDVCGPDRAAVRGHASHTRARVRFHILIHTAVLRLRLYLDLNKRSPYIR